MLTGIEIKLLGFQIPCSERKTGNFSIYMKDQYGYMIHYFNQTELSF